MLLGSNRPVENRYAWRAIEKRAERAERCSTPIVMRLGEACISPLRIIDNKKKIQQQQMPRPVPQQIQQQQMPRPLPQQMQQIQQIQQMQMPLQQQMQQMQQMQQQQMQQMQLQRQMQMQQMLDNNKKCIEQLEKEINLLLGNSCSSSH